MTRRFRIILSGSCALLSAVLCLAYGEHVREESERVRAEALEREKAAAAEAAKAERAEKAARRAKRSDAAKRTGGER